MNQPGQSGVLEQMPTFSEVISEGLKSNTFSNVAEDDVPLSIDAISKQRQQSNRQRSQEEIGFAIMTRNAELLSDLLGLPNGIDDVTCQTLNNMNALHLAATYLDGSKQCCMILDTLSSQGLRNPRDQFGHTVLDNLFISILKSHTIVAPGAVSISFQAHTRFPGEEVDICGRWDADSPCIQELYASGQARIPFDWNHEFFQTSVQTICHSITNLFTRDYPIDITVSSGIFNSICESCGHESSAYPIHALVLVAFHLANAGNKDETLFGALACLICLLFCGANPFLKASITPPG